MTSIATLLKPPSDLGSLAQQTSATGIDMHGSRQISILVRTTNFSKFLLGALLMSAGLAQAGSEISYGFEFDLTKDSQHAAILSYKYSAGSRVLISRKPSDFADFKGLYGESMRAPMPRGTSLQVKWKDTKTNEVFEDTVNLGNRLPKDMSEKIISLMIFGPQLYIFVTSDEPHVPGAPIIGPSIKKRKTTIQIYPGRPQI